jgi:hypothetical protein
MTLPLAPWTVDEPLPLVLRDKDLMRVLNLAPSSFYKLKAKGKFKVLEVKRGLTGGTRYSTKLVQRYVDGDSMAAFGAGSRVDREEASAR